MEDINSHNILIIGNGPDLLKEDYGDFINKNFETVVRCNIAPIKDYEKYVGSKTDYRMCFSKILEKIKENFDDKNLIVSIPNEGIKKFRHFKGKAKGFKKNNEDYNVKILGRKIIKELIETYELKNPSVGFMAMYHFSEAFTKKIYYVGFDGYTEKKAHYYHALESGKRNNFHKKIAKNFHNIELERTILDKYIESGILIHINNIFKINE